jgi:hypothetical protein
LIVWKGMMGDSQRASPERMANSDYVTMRETLFEAILDGLVGYV